MAEVILVDGEIMSPLPDASMLGIVRVGVKPPAEPGISMGNIKRECSCEEKT